MSEQRAGGPEAASETEDEGGQTQEQRQDEGLMAEQESAAAMDADVPQPPAADQTTEGQPS